MKSWAIVVAMVLVSGCVTRARVLRRECGEGRAGEVQCASFEQLECRPSQIKTINAAVWLAYGCGHYAACDTVRRDWVCTLLPSPEARAKSELSVKTGCAEPTINLVSSAPHERMFGSYRMSTCKGDWICEVDDGVHCTASP